MTSYLLRKTFKIGQISSGMPCRELMELEIIAEAKEEVVDAIKEDICAESEAWDLSKIQSWLFRASCLELLG